MMRLKIGSDIVRDISLSLIHIYPTWYNDILIKDEDGNTSVYFVNRVSVPIQAMAIDIILAHLLGNKTHIVDGTLKENPALPIYKEYWLSLIHI